MLAFIFPGQGSQTPGMGKDLAARFPAAREVFEEADDALDQPLSRLIFEGTEEELKRTEVTQPAILTTSIATLRALQSERPDLKAEVAAGHSLGEWSALVAVGALTFKDAVRLVRLRGRFMQEAVPPGEGSMAAIVGLTIDAVRDACQQAVERTGQVVSPANMNAPDQTVISGATEGVEEAQRCAEAAGAKRVIPLPVSAPFHCDLMKPAAERLAEALEPIEVGPFSAPVINNVQAEAYRSPEQTKELLIRQVTAPVRWVESTQRMKDDGVDTALEIGPGKVLMGLVRRIDRSLRVLPTENPDALAKAFAALSVD